jgi:hypothetical protein
MRTFSVLGSALVVMMLAGCAPPDRYELDRAGATGDEAVELFILRDTESGVEAAIAPARGGELSGLRVRFAEEWLETLYLARDYSPRKGWTGEAPLLWPATGRNFPPDLEERRKAGEVFDEGAWEWNGQRYPMPIHGFVRDLAWELESAEAAVDAPRARVTLEDTAETRRMYPFGFRITAEYTLAQGALEIRYDVTADADNEGAMPFSIGNHITFVTPLVPGGDAGKVVLVTPSSEELLKTDYGVPTGETRPRSHADGIELAALERLRAFSLTGYSGEPFVELRDPAGLTIRMSHRASEVPNAPVILFNLWGGAAGGFFSPEPWVGLQNSLLPTSTVLGGA